MVLLKSSLIDVLGGRSAKLLSTAFAYETVEDLLRHYPRRYAKRGELTDLKSLRIGEHATVLAEVASVKEAPMKGRRTTRLEVVVTDGKKTIDLAFFAMSSMHKKRLIPGIQGLFAGKVQEYRGRKQLIHPEYVLTAAAGEETDPDVIEMFAKALIPVYPGSSNVPSWRTSKAVKFIMSQLEFQEYDDVVPENIQKKLELITFKDAIINIHQPETMEQVASSLKRLKFDEAFVLQSVLLQRRAKESQLLATARSKKTADLVSIFDKNLPFELTNGQIEIGELLFAEIAQTHPMHRLLQGDVGSGKTIVALRAMLAAVDAGGQAALLAPTEVLAMQHFKTIKKLMGNLATKGEIGGSEIGTRVELLTGSIIGSNRAAVLANIKNGDAGIVIGTHALIQEGVKFNDLALVVVDEQHRFGVEQRAALAAKAVGDTRPHVLVMTATPIPRTVAMTVFGDLDICSLKELPKGRSPITTRVVYAHEKPNHLERAWQRAVEEVKNKHQVYIVCPRIGGDVAEDDTRLDSEEEKRAPLAVLEVAPMLAGGPLKDVRVGILHGRMSSEEKDDIMRRFNVGPNAKEGLDVLVSTTVIEVGVDVPNATMMIILDSDRFGVSQLHQLRGRIGRGKDAGLCIFVTEALEDSPARERLAAVAETTDGFELAQLDLEIRREGNVLGSRQSGKKSSLKLLQVVKDIAIVELARDACKKLIDEDFTLSQAPALQKAVDEIEKEAETEFLEKN
jgi:ATP-dependent DNA helicase RecG